MRWSWLLLSLVPAASWAAEIAAPSVVGEVVVFPDRARVSRTATVKLDVGEHEIVVLGMPLAIDVESLRASGSGTAQVVLGSVDVRNEYRADAANEKVRKLELRIQELSDADRVLADEADAAEFTLKTLRDIQIKGSGKVGEGALETLVPPGPIVTSLLDVTGERYRAAKRIQREIGVQRREVAAQIEALRQELAELQGAAGRTELVAAVSVVVKKAGSLELELQYTMGGASWQPTYDVRADPVAGTVGLTYGAWVQQGTGEDWSDARLVLSTARPQLGVQPPEPDPWILRHSPPPRPSRSYGAGGGMARSAPAEAKMEMDDGDYAEEVYAAEVQVAQVDTGGPSVEFGVPGSVTVRGDGTRKRVTIAEWVASKAKLEHIAVPELSPFAFLTARVTHDQAFPLLPGEVQAFLGDSYVGRAWIDAVAAGEEARFAFGVDEQVSVERKLLQKGEGKKGLFSGKEQVEWSYRTTVTSFHNRPVTVLLKERIPVSENDKIVVKLSDDTTPGSKMDERGIAVWTLSLAAKAKQEIAVGYTVAFPPDERPWGI